jgi:hypothetical protein
MTECTINLCLIKKIITMNRLDLNLLSVQEMDDSEMQAVDGGCFAIITAAVVAIFLAVDYLQDGHIDGAIYF